MAVPQARLRATRFGLVPDGEGWFVVNAADSRWRDFGPLGVGCDFEVKRPFRQLGRRRPRGTQGPGLPPRAGRARTWRLPAGLAAASLIHGGHAAGERRDADGLAALLHPEVKLHL